MAWEPDRRYNNFFFSPPAHLCAVTYMTEISLIVTLNNQSNSNSIHLFKRESHLSGINAISSSLIYEYAYVFHYNDM